MMRFPWERTPQQRYAEGWDALWGKKPEKTEAQKACKHPAPLAISINLHSGPTWRCEACDWRWTEKDVF